MATKASTAETLTAEDIKAQVDTHLREAAEAEEALGVAALDGRGIEQAESRLAKARAHVARMRAAMEAHSRRDVDAELAAEARARAARLATALEWKAELVRRSGPLLAAQDALRQAEDHLDELGSCPIDPLRDADFRMLVIDAVGFDEASMIPNSTARPPALGERSRFTCPAPASVADPERAIGALLRAAAKQHKEAGDAGR